MGRPASKAISGSSGVYPYAKPAGSLANRPLASWSMPSPACSMDANPTSPGSTNIPSLSRPCERIRHPYSIAASGHESVCTRGGDGHHAIPVGHEAEIVYDEVSQHLVEYLLPLAPHQV